jgi:hypothetical protein
MDRHAGLGFRELEHRGPRGADSLVACLKICARSSFERAAAISW